MLICDLSGVQELSAAQDLYDFSIFCIAIFVVLVGVAIVSIYIEHAWDRARAWWSRRHKSSHGRGNGP